MKNSKLSLFSYFGGKARFCREIAELLDYNHTNIYIEPFGGAASVLLNKPTHNVELYSDVSRGLVALMGCLSDSDKAPILIESLYDTVYSEECFLEHMEYRNSVDDNYLKAAQLKELKKRKELSEKVMRKLKKTGYLKELKNLPDDKQRELIEELVKGDSILSPEDKQAIKDIEEDEVGRVLLDMENFDINENVGVIEDPDELKLAVATYVQYSMSRDGMGTAFSSSKFRSSEAYYKHIDRLYDVADRLNGVQVTGSVGTLTYLLECSYLDDPKAMFYIDAPYLSADQNQKNLGICYKGQMEVEDHRLLLQTISKSKAKFLISNYDTPVYNYYLGDWNKVTIDTVTGVGSKKNNKRTECLWYNY